MRLPAVALFACTLVAQQPAPAPERPAANQEAAETPVNPEPELGAVHWQRDLPTALAIAAKAGKPAFLLFQEIPGCSTCTGFGKDVLGHPLLVAAIEECFVPVAIRNNVAGAEQAVRERYEEPAWNNPVVRFVDAAGKDLLPRRDALYDAHRIAARMVAALQAAKRPVPGYLEIALGESDPQTERAVFAMHCFWEGEAVLGAVPGVIATSAAFADGAEVVAVTFRPAVVSRAQLTELAQAKSCRAVAVASPRAAPASDQQHALGGTPYGTLELTPMQRTKVHSALTLGGDPLAWLTAAQRKAVARLQAEPPRRRD